MSFGVEDHPIEIDRVWCEEQVEILKRLGEEKARHRIRLLHRLDRLQRRVSLISTTVLHKVAPETLTHKPVLLILRVTVKVISRLDDFRSQRVTRRSNLLRAIVKLLRLDTGVPPHP